jgi:hypothetical protein
MHFEKKGGLEGAMLGFPRCTNVNPYCGCATYRTTAKTTTKTPTALIISVELI